MDFNLRGCKSCHALCEVTGTSCNQRVERITGTEHAKILRVPFRSKAGILRKWISRCTQAGAVSRVPAITTSFEL